MFGHKDMWRWKENTLKAVHYLATIVIRESDIVVEPAKQAMQWFKAVGFAAAANENSLYWVTPAGLPVYHKYTGNAEIKVRLRYLTDVKFSQVSFYNGVESWSPQRMANALSPNVIHSLDGSHMAFVVIDAAKNGVTSIGGIHDCFACLPSDMDTLRNTVRNTFAKMYTPNVFKHITTTLLNQLTPQQREKVPLLPKQGNLKVADVANSNYFIT
jgi:DNA-directed RNA polymerase